MKLIILDRDGVINEDSDAFIKTVDEWRPIAGSIEAMARLYKAGYTLAVATNQSGIARGLYDEATLAAMHEKLASLLAAEGAEVAKIVYCPHGPDDNCPCRKPKPGLFQQIAEFFQQSLDGVVTIGDSWRDLEAGMAAGCSPVLVRTGKGQRTLQSHAAEITALNIPVYDDLQQAVAALLDQ